MSELVFDALLENLKDACKSVALKPFPLEEVFNVAAAGRKAREEALKDIKVEGGALPCDLLTAIDVVTVATVFFPPFDRSLWRETSAVHVAADADNEASFVIREFERR
jgi:hypothetical protein